MKTIETASAPGAIGPYSQAKVHGGQVYTSGQLPLDPKTGELAGATAAEQTEQVIANLKAILEAAGSSLSQVLKTTCFLTDMGEFAEFNAVYSKYFSEKPARSTVAVAALAKGARVEVDAVGIVP
jgi:2-iminobutanoate/2-iminopropanoate deaminase